MKPYYEHAGITIYHGDCREVLSVTMLFDAVITDPPFAQTSLRWDRWIQDWPSVAPSRSLWCFGNLRLFMDHCSEFTAGEWKLSQDVIWEKHNGSNFYADRFRRVHEQPAHFYRGEWRDVYKAPLFTMDATARAVRRKGRPNHTGHIDASAYQSFDGGPRLKRSVMRVKSCHGEAQNETQKPIGILEPLIQYSCPPGGVVCDMFAGSGSTGVAAKLLGRRAVLIEIREEQCEIAATRLSQEALPLEVA